MSSRHARPLPGTTLKEIVQEHQYLTEFLALFKKCIDAEKEYLKKLEEIRSSINLKWHESRIWPLVSPFLDYLKLRIGHREDANTSLIVQLDEQTDIPPPNIPDEDGVTPEAKYERIEAAYDAYQSTFRAINSKESISELKAWFRLSRRVDDVKNMAQSEISSYILPKIDRKYRQAVVTQQIYSHSAATWHREILPKHLEYHQELVESIQKLLGRVMTEHSKTATELVKASQKAQYAIASFSSSAFIAPHHARQEEESSHLLMKPTEYHNHYIEGRPAKPILGLSSPIALLQTIYQTTGGFRPPHNGLRVIPIAEAFQLEDMIGDNAGLVKFIEAADATTIGTLVTTAFLSAPCLIPISDEVVRRYRYTKSQPGIPRDKLTPLLASVPRPAQLAIQNMMQYLSLPQIASTDVAAILSHRPDANVIVESIYHKWDFENDCPIQKRHIRIWSDVGAPPLALPPLNRMLSPPSPVSPTTGKNPVQDGVLLPASSGEGGLRDTES